MATSTLRGSTPAGNVIYDNTQSGMTATDVQDAIDELSAELAKNKYGTSTTLVGLTSYTAPSDGYVQYTVLNGTSYLLFQLSSNGNASQIVVPQNASYNTGNIIFVKKGTVIDHFTNTETILAMSFVPLVS